MQNKYGGGFDGVQPSMWLLPCSPLSVGYLPHWQLPQHPKKHTPSLVQEKLWAGIEQRGNPGWQLPS